jgi:hypothetical protein
MNNLRFLLDTNCFIEPCNTYYPFCYAPAFWAALIHGHEAGMVFTLNEVKKEITEKKIDEISNWIGQKGFPATFVQKVTDVTIQRYKEIQNWVGQHPYFSRSEKNKFADKKTDGYLVAHAKASNMVIVTQEKFIVDPKATRIKIPNLCKQFDVECINLFGMLKQLNVRFVLEQ